MCTGAEAPVAAEGAEVVAGGAKGAGEVAAVDAGASATMPAAVAETGGAAAVESGAAGTSGAVGGATGAEALMPPAAAEPGGAPAVEAGAPGTSGASTTATGSDVLGTIKTLAPAVSAGANLLAAGASVAQAQLASGAAKPGAVPAVPQSPIDPDVAALRRRNSLLFGTDSPAATDITRGGAEAGSLGRATLLGGSSKLGG